MCRVQKLKDGVEGYKNMLFQDRREIEEMQHNVLRMKKYDDFFGDCNNKILYN